MTYVRLDTRYDDSRKVCRAWKADPRAVGLHIMAITYCQRQKLDGKVPDDWLQGLLPKATDRNRALKTLVDAELFDLEPHDEGRYRVHDFLDWNESAAEREVRSDKARRAAEARYANTNGRALRVAKRSA